MKHLSNIVSSLDYFVFIPLFHYSILSAYYYFVSWIDPFWIFFFFYSVQLSLAIFCVRDCPLHVGYLILERMWGDTPNSPNLFDVHIKEEFNLLLCNWSPHRMPQSSKRHAVHIPSQDQLNRFLIVLWPMPRVLLVRKIKNFRKPYL